MRVCGFLRRQCGYLQSRWTNPTLLLLLILLAVLQIFGGAKNNKETKRRSFEDTLQVSAPKNERISGQPKSHHCYGLPSSSNLAECAYNSPLLIGSIEEKMNLKKAVNREEALDKRGPCLSQGGCFKPSSCKSQQKVAILIPYKDREAHLLTLLSFLHPQLQRQEIHYCVFVVEQLDDGRFNKGLLMNAGFLQILNSFGHFDCFVFHDVDMVPEDDRNIYLCQNEPTHLSPFIDKFGYRSHYGTDWGGVTMIRPEQYSKANGYSNMFWGWGREDSDMEWRLNAKGIKAIRPINEVNARFSMIPHEHPWRFQNEKFNLGSAAKMTTKEKLMMTKRERSSWDGVNNAKFRLDHVVYDKLFTKLLIDIRRFEVEELQVVIDQKKMKINQTKGECHFKTFNNTYLDPNFRMKIGEDRSGYFAEAVAEAHCNDAGQACAGIIRDRGAASADGRDWILREKAILLTPDEYRFTTGKGHSSGVPANLLTKMKICQGQMSNVYPFLSTAKNAVYKSRMRLKFLLPLTTSLIYRDIVLFEGWPTGFSHEYPVEIRPEETRENLSFSFQTGEFTLPTYSGWYTVQAKISDRFDQTWFEWSFQFRVDENSQEAASKRLQYLQEIKEKLAKYKEESKSGHEHIKEKRALMEAFSHGKDIR